MAACISSRIFPVHDTALIDVLASWTHDDAYCILQTPKMEFGYTHSCHLMRSKGKKFPSKSYY